MKVPFYAGNFPVVMEVNLCRLSGKAKQRSPAACVQNNNWPRDKGMIQREYMYVNFTQTILNVKFNIKIILNNTKLFKRYEKRSGLAGKRVDSHCHPKGYL